MAMGTDMTGFASAREAEDYLRKHEEFRDACEDLVRMMARNFDYETGVPSYAINRIHYAKALALVQQEKDHARE
jgi:hypothetical protein